MDREDRLGDYYGVKGGWGKRGGKVEWGEGRVGEKEGGREKREGGGMMMKKRREGCMSKCPTSIKIKCP